MAISKRKDRQGRHVGYQVVVSAPDSKTGKPKRYTVGSFRLKSVAESAERKALDQIQSGTFMPDLPAPPQIWTVTDVVMSWIAGKRATLTANSLDMYLSAWRTHLRDTIGDRDIMTLSRADVKALARGWQASGMGAELQRRCMLVLRGALDEAVDDGILAANPAIGIRLPSPKRRHDLPQWTSADLRAFLEEAERDQLGAFWTLTALEGMRRGEALGLRWHDLHWSDDESACVAVITQTVITDRSRGGAPMIQNRAKTVGSQRSVQLTRTTIEALKRHRDRQAFQRQSAGDLWHDLDLIVADEVGNPVRPDLVNGHRRRVMDRASVPAIRTHDLRHQAITLMLRGGVSPALVALKVGHADIGTTVGRYGHLAVSDQQAANDAIEQSLAHAPGID